MYRGSLSRGSPSRGVSVRETPLADRQMAVKILPCHKLHLRAVKIKKEESIPVGCIPSACKPYLLQWPPPDVTFSSCEQV